MSARNLVVKDQFSVESVRIPLNSRLQILTGDNRGAVFFLKDERVVIGRGEKCQIKIADVKASREHAELVWIGDHYVLSDLNSQNGILHNENAIKQVSLKNNDKFVIGQTVFLYKNQIYQEKKQDDEVSVKRKKITSVLVVAIVLITLLILYPVLENDKKLVEKKSIVQNDIGSDISSDLIRTIEKKKRVKSKEMSSQVKIILNRGLRELREKNYFRAITEFNHALDISPNDAQANFYMRRAKEELDLVIKELNSIAVRDLESLQFKRAVTSYCSVVRLLYNYQEDIRFKSAQENIEKIEEKLGYEKGEIRCL